MIELVLQCLIVGHKEIGPSLYETDLLCPGVRGLTLTYQSTERDATSAIFLGIDKKDGPVVYGHVRLDL